VSSRHQGRKARNKDRRIEESRRSLSRATGKGSRKMRNEAGNAIINPDLSIRHKDSSFPRRRA
jgi:hypothetical protein